MPDPQTIRRAPPAVDTSAGRLTQQSELLRLEIRRSMGYPAEAGFDALLMALAVRQREAVHEALAWGEHSRDCLLLREKTAMPGEPLPGCSCGFDDALDRLAPKEGW